MVKLRLHVVTFVIVLALFILPIAHSSVMMYVITPPDIDGPYSYGFIVPLEGNRYTAFVIEKTGGQTITMCTNYFVEQAKQLLALSLGSYVQCTAGVKEVYVDIPPQGETIQISKSVNLTIFYAYVVNISGMIVLPSKFPGNRVEISVKTTSGVNTGGGAFDILGALRSFFDVVWKSITLLGQAIMSAGQVFGAIGEGFKAIAVWIGKPGEPDAIMYYNLYRLQLLSMSDIQVVQEVLQCRKPISSALHLMTSLYSNTSLKYTDKTLCEIEAMQPSGVIGMLQVLFTTVLSVRSYFVFIFQNFVLINIGIISAVLLYGAYKSITTKKLDEMIKAFNIIYKIFSFYWSIIKFIAETVWRVIQMIAEFIQAILPF